MSEPKPKFTPHGDDQYTQGWLDGAISVAALLSPGRSHAYWRILRDKMLAAKARGKGS